MICKNCATAGDLARRAKDMEQSQSEDSKQRRSQLFLNDMFRVAKELHTYCMGQTHCDCQHRLIEVTECVNIEVRSPSEQTK